MTALWYAVVIPTVWFGIALLEAVAERWIESDYAPRDIER